MAEIPPPNLTGAVPPPKKETGKVQPKKETVRINLPPKSSAAPTIKLPTLPPGGPTGAPSAAPAPFAAPKPAAALLATAASAKAAAAPVSQIRPAAPATQRPVIVAAPTISGLDKILAIAAMIAALFAVGSVLYLWLGIPIAY
jgi:hypothetical protein